MIDNNIYNELYCKNPTCTWEFQINVPIVNIIKGINLFFEKKKISWAINRNSELFLKNFPKPFLISTYQECLELVNQDNFQDLFIYSNSFFLGEEKFMEDAYYKNETLQFLYEKETSILEFNVYLDVFANKIEYLNNEKDRTVDLSDIAPTNRELLNEFLLFLINCSKGEIIRYYGHYREAQSSIGINDNAISFWH